MKRLKKVLCIFLALCLSLGLLSACTTPPQSPAGQTPTQPDASDPLPETPPQQALPVSLPVELSQGFDPYETRSAANRLVLELVLEPLFAVSPEGEPIPVLATDYTVSADGLTTEIALRTGVTLQDGTPLTASLVAQALTQARSSGIYKERLQALTSVTPGENTVTLTTDRAYECLPLLLDMPIALLSGDLPVGTGPYAFRSEGELIPSPGWRQDAAYPAGETEVQLIPVTSARDLRQGFLYGDLSALFTDPNGDNVLGDISRQTLYAVETTVLQYVGFILQKGVFSSAAIRSAVTFAIDREAIVREDMGSFGVAVTLATRPGSVWEHLSLLQGYGYYPQNLADSLGGAKTATMIVSDQSDQRIATARRIAASLTDCGITVELKVLTPSAFSAALENGDFDLYYAETRLSPNLDLSPFFLDGGSLAYGGLSTWTEAAELCRQTLANRGNAYDLQKLILKQGLICPVAFKKTVICVKNGIFSDVSPQLGGWSF